MEYTFRNIENVYDSGVPLDARVLVEDFYANSLSISYVYSINMPWMMVHSIRVT